MGAPQRGPSIRQRVGIQPATLVVPCGRLSAASQLQRPRRFISTLHRGHLLVPVYPIASSTSYGVSQRWRHCLVHVIGTSQTCWSTGIRSRVKTRESALLYRNHPRRDHSYPYTIFGITSRSACNVSNNTEHILVEKRICGLNRLSFPAEGASPAPDAPEMTFVRAGITATSGNNASPFPFLAPFPLSVYNSVREQFFPDTQVRCGRSARSRSLPWMPLSAAFQCTPRSALNGVNNGSLEENKK